MPASPLRQQYLDLGEPAVFDLLHGGHRDNIAVATKAPKWNQRNYQHDEAMAVAFAMQGWADSYLSQNGFTGKRGVSTVSALTSCFADLDVYNVGRAGLTFEELLDWMQATYPWLPLPTVTISSGRGFYVNWILLSPLAHYQLPRWQAIQDALVALLADVGADANAKDAARVLRIVGSVNSKSGETVTAMQTGPTIAFEQLERLVLSHALPAKPRPHLRLVADNTNLERVQRVSAATPAQRRQHIVGYQLAFDRMTDYGTIARMRGSPRMPDYRHRLLFCYAVSGAWYWSSIELAEEELAAFARSHFADSGRYKARRVQTVLDRMSQGKQGEKQVSIWGKMDRRYRMRNDTIIATLDITPGEQRRLKTVIGPAEHENRRIARRRAAGMVSYADRTPMRLRTILAGRAQGMTQTAIAAELGITQSGVSKLLKREREASKLTREV